MMDLIRTWLLGITGAAMVTALAESLMPRGAVRRIGRLTGGLILLLAVLQPVATLDEGALAGALERYRQELSAYDSGLEETSASLMKGIIAEQSDAYILDKAAALGITCSVEVETAPGEGGYPVPHSVTIRGRLTGGQREALSRQITADFAIPAERQYYESGEDG